MTSTAVAVSPRARTLGAAAAREDVQRLARQAAAYADEAQASSTRRAYSSSWRTFADWCWDHGASALPADAATVALFLTDLAPERSLATLGVHLAAIADAHAAAGHLKPESEALSAIWSGIRRQEARDPTRKRALVTRELRSVVRRLPDDVAGVRDRALLLVGFAGALRRSELAALSLDPDTGVCAGARLRFVAGGLHIRLARSKTDQEGAGQVVAIPHGKTALCPVRALRAWLDLADISAGPVFREVDRHGRVGEAALEPGSVARILKRAVGRAGFAPDDFSGHSLRAGLVTAAAEAGVATELIMRQTRHTKADTVAIYVREADLFRRNAAAKVGL